MAEKHIPLAFFYSWQHVTDSMIPNIMAEFKWHGVDNLVFTDHLLSRVVNELRFWSLLHRHAVLQGINLIEAGHFFKLRREAVLHLCTAAQRRAAAGTGS